MNKDTTEGYWKQMKGRIKKEWGKITDDEIDKAEGDMDRLEGIIQEKYGENRDKIKKKLSQLKNAV